MFRMRAKIQLHLLLFQQAQVSQLLQLFLQLLRLRVCLLRVESKCTFERPPQEKKILLLAIFSQEEVLQACFQDKIQVLLQVVSF